MSASTPRLKGLTVEEARARMLAAVTPLPAESIALAEADGRVLAQPVIAHRDQPPFDASAMDGWAVRRADLAAETTLRIVGESAAGHGYVQPLKAGEAVRIFTGAPIPAGADLVVIQEEAVREGETVRLGPAGQPNHVRPRGGDFHTGETLLAAGVKLDPWRLSLAAAAGQAALSVARRPRIVLLATGEELAQPGDTPGPFQIFESGGVGLAAMIRRWGGEPHRLAATGDDIAAIADAVREVQADLIVTVGGASVGDHDLVKPALETLGLTLAVETINIRPGKPTWFGTLGAKTPGGGRRVLGLPGNPASAFVCAELFLKSLVLAMLGADPAPRLELIALAQSLPANGPREHWARARITPGGVRAFADQDSSLVTVFAQADALLRRAANAPAAGEGELVEILRLERG
ncbi:molybdopterin molybdotransferase [Caulobacter ginsengisoli]|uniref:Molybdopterin molybdenumtransferase n=1 Tax=Caulobacter ginsengisoli TaxID=400775 RepID=A0ABU0IWR1_9CAUL|nr:gephyrin-like molybdotransferase Glp [Caulobacter ginsengisoli]MDQ0466462.1 molybdopterin molybdotransferase [Caulobacter ginsengisoli]